jgi:hypothetical protein
MGSAAIVALCSVACTVSLRTLGFHFNCATSGRCTPTCWGGREVLSVPFGGARWRGSCRSWPP